MRKLLSKPLIIIGLLVLFVGALILLKIYNTPAPIIPAVTKTVALDNKNPIHTVIGRSVQGRNIDAYTYGVGKTHLAFIGGVHGGYEWNSVVLAYGILDYLDTNPGVIPVNLTVTIIPDANPDGVFKVIGKEGRFLSTDVPANISMIPGRLNANKVDLNRNFDCKWQPDSTWQNKPESAGTKPFSEPESRAIKNFILFDKSVAVIFWHSQSGNVYASRCLDGTLPETIKIMNTYAKASGYSAVETFSAYETTGDSEGWLASIGIPAITVELKTHNTVELEQNIAGVKAIFDYYKFK